MAPFRAFLLILFALMMIAALAMLIPYLRAVEEGAGSRPRPETNAKEIYDDADGIAFRQE